MHHPRSGAGHHGEERPAGNGHYRRLAIMLGLSFMSMFVLMYAMVDAFANVHGNLNQVYMAGLMTAPMAIIEILLMGAMYPDKRRNAVIAAAALVALLGFWVLIRQQAAISDRQFLKSMIPHHAGAILMCRKAPVEDPRIQTLCQGILQSAGRDRPDACMARGNETIDLGRCLGILGARPHSGHSLNAQTTASSYDPDHNPSGSKPMHPRSIVVPALAAVSLFFPAAAEAQVRASERGGVFQIVDGTTITLEYSRPVARGRLLFGPGAVVPYGHRWTPGANWATTLETDRDIQVNGQPVPKGKYSVWMVPGPEEWTVMLSRMAHAFHVQPPADSSAQARFVVKPATGAHMETLAWYFPVIAPHAATLRLHWGTTIVPLHLTVQPSRPVVLDPAERAPYVGKYQLASQLEGLSEPRILEVFEIDGRVRARVTPALFDHDAELDLVPAGRGRFHPGWYLAGKFFDVETDMAFIFTVERGRARSVDFRGLAENLLFAHGERIP